jgi:uncharacterized RDD family membrane protein YckC
MRGLPFSIMLMDMFAGILAIMMVVIAVLLFILIGANTMRNEAVSNEPLIMTAALFLIGGAGFYALQRWAKSKQS